MRNAIADTLLDDAPELARRVAERHYAERPDFVERYGEIGRVRTREDAEYHVRYLAEALRNGSPDLFTAYVAWAREMLAARRVPWDVLQRNLEIVRDEVTRDLDNDAKDAVDRIIDAAVDLSPVETESFLTSTPQAALAHAYLTALLEADRRTAVSLVDGAVRGGLSIRELYLHVFQPVQREIGRRWQRNQISVAEEHYCTAATQALMAQFYAQVLSTPRIGRRIVVAAVGNELHEIGIRMVADFFELAGWDSIYLGANTPAQSLVDLVCREQPHLVALAVTMTYHLPALRVLIDKLRGEQRCVGVKIIVGGHAFRLRQGLWQSAGADGFADDAEEAVQLGGRLIDGR